MSPTRRFVLSVREPEAGFVLEDARTRRRVHLGDLAEIGDQIERWRAEDGPFDLPLRPEPDKDAP